MVKFPLVMNTDVHALNYTRSECDDILTWTSVSFSYTFRKITFKCNLITRERFLDPTEFWNVPCKLFSTLFGILGISQYHLLGILYNYNSVTITSFSKFCNDYKIFQVPLQKLSTMLTGHPLMLPHHHLL